MLREFERDAQQVQAIHRHPARAVGLIDKAAGGQRGAAVEHTDVIEAEETTLKNISSLRVLAVDPPGEIQKQFMEDAFKKFHVTFVMLVNFTAMLAIHLEHAPRRPRVDGRIHISERPFVGRQLAVRVHEPFAREQIELALGKFRVNQRERDAVERQIPCGIPRVFPFIRHRNNVGVVHVRPVGVARAFTFRRRRRLGGIAVEPRPHVEVVKLF